MNLVNNRFFHAGIILSVFVLTGCTGFGGTGLDANREDMTTWGAKTLIQDEKFQKINLVEELYSGTDLVPNPNTNTLKQAFDSFYANLETKDDDGQVLGRNRIQERILAASQDRCNAYFTFLDGMDAETNFILGSFTTAVAGAGAIFTNLTTVRALSGIASITSGIRSEFNEDYFANQTMEIMRKGIEARRREIYTSIKTKQSNDLKTYTVEEAVKDAIDYHGACSLTAGLLKLGLSLERAENPGITQAEKILAKAQGMVALVNRGSYSNELLAKLSSDKIGDVWTPIINAVPPGSPKEAALTNGMLDKLGVVAPTRVEALNEFLAIQDAIKNPETRNSAIEKMKPLQFVIEMVEATP